MKYALLLRANRESSSIAVSEIRDTLIFLADFELYGRLHFFFLKAYFLTFDNMTNYINNKSH